MSDVKETAFAMLEDLALGLLGQDPAAYDRDAIEWRIQAISEMFAATPASTPAEALPSQTSGAEAITARYTNWQGVTAERTFIPHRVFFGSNEWHPEPQVLIEATDCEKGALRTFAAAGFSPTPAFTYSSTQATKCACCGEHKHTPLRRDDMGGYVCLTCIDKQLTALAKPASEPAR